MKHELIKLRKSRGFSLMELLIAIAIIGIIAAIAFPSYENYILRANRADGHNWLLDIGNRQQQYFLDNRGYGTLAQLGLGGAGDNFSPEGHYAVTIVVPNPPSTYTLTAAPRLRQTNDTDCGSLTYNSEGVSGQTGGGSRCW